MRNSFKPFVRVNIVTSLLLSLTVFATPVVAAEECAKNDFTSIFIEEFYGNVKWDNRVFPREITWSTEVSSVDGAAVARQLTEAEAGWLQESFNSWDLALDTIKFRRITDGQMAAVKVGLVAIDNNGFWTVEQRGDYRDSGTIKLSTLSPFLTTRSGFIEAAQSEIGNLLGLGDIAENFAADSVMKDPDTAPYGSIPLSDFDIDLIRQFYGESTCHSSWSQPLKDSKAAVAAALAAEKAAEKAAAALALAKVASEAQAKLDAGSRGAISQAVQDAEAARKAQEKLDRAEIAAFQASLKGKRSITCVKGVLTKRITTASSKCPSGFKKV